MKIVIPGGTGQVGRVLERHFIDGGHEVVIIGRKRAAVIWDGQTLGDWSREFNDADVVINLAGRSVNCRYNAKNREQMMQSRVVTTRLVGEAIAQAERPPGLWLQASTATIYAHRYDAPNDEATGIIGGGEHGAPDTPDTPETWDFSIAVAKSWEQALDDAVVPHTRKVALRSAMTMSPDRGGIFRMLLALTRRGLGGTAGDGRQYISWIHETDFTAAIDWIIEHDDLAGPINLAAPEPLPNREFMRILRQAWGKWVGLPATRWMLELGAFFMRTETELVMKSRRVVPGLLLARGFEFQYPQWSAAATELCQRVRAGA